MILKISKYAGFCFGVLRAVEAVFECSDKKIKIFGEIAHNEILINKLKKNQNITFIKDLKEVSSKDTLIIRAHGISLNLIDKFNSLGIKIIDMTCPKIKLAYHIAVAAKINGNQLIIIGDLNHPEIIGIKSRNENAIIISDLDEAEKFVKNLKLKNQNFIAITQTTYDNERYLEICNFLKKNLKKIDCKNTICRDAINRQNEIRENSKKSDLVIIIGSKISSNAKKLFDISSKSCETVLVDDENDFNFEMVKSKKYIFLCSAASAMKETVNNFITILKQYS
ncbi:MAG: 4-hydroxy-3-methylbut-2-enyl diphosphate reductase [Oscillospiraceae bacterium]|nr:4-hydroxy-3-methylbut-2-enyl diphosphate reductase [Oscillospiraceae bacterium]